MIQVSYNIILLTVTVVRYKSSALLYYYTTLYELTDEKYAAIFMQ